MNQLISQSYQHYEESEVMERTRRAKLGQIQGGVAEGHPRFDKGGVAIIFFYFLRVKNRTF